MILGRFNDFEISWKFCSAVININNFSGVSVPARTISAITTELYLESSALDNFDEHFHNSLGILHFNDSIAIKNMSHIL